MSKKEYPYARMSPITVMEDFPIGTVIKRHWNVDHTGEHTSEEKVEGYIFDGKYWVPAYGTWDGWCGFTEMMAMKFIIQKQMKNRRQLKIGWLQ